MASRNTYGYLVEASERPRNAPTWSSLVRADPGRLALADPGRDPEHLQVVPKRPAQDGYTLVELADDVDAFMDAIGLSSAVLLGSSSGGYVAQQVAVGHPHRVRGLVLVGSPRSLRGRPPFADEVDRLTDPVDRAWVRASLEWFPRFHDIPGWYVEDRIDDGLRMPANVWRKTLIGLSTAVPPTETGTITVPTLIIRGDRDDLLVQQDQEALAVAIPGSRLVVYNDTGHLVLWEQPQRVASDLIDFVTSLSA